MRAAIPGLVIAALALSVPAPLLQARTAGDSSQESGTMIVLPGDARLDVERLVPHRAGVDPGRLGAVRPGPGDPGGRGVFDVGELGQPERRVFHPSGLLLERLRAIPPRPWGSWADPARRSSRGCGRRSSTARSNWRRGQAPGASPSSG